MWRSAASMDCTVWLRRRMVALEAQPATRWRSPVVRARQARELPADDNQHYCPGGLEEQKARISSTKRLRREVMRARWPPGTVTIREPGMPSRSASAR
jgi:hypothetical protein